MSTHEGDYGSILIVGHSVTVTADDWHTAAWATRPGARWPGSALSGDMVRAEYDAGDLVDMDGPEDVSAHELSAWSDDAIRAAGAEDAARAAGYRFHE